MRRQSRVTLPTETPSCCSRLNMRLLFVISFCYQGLAFVTSSVSFIATIVKVFDAVNAIVLNRELRASVRL
eukprot:COSAG06_NODE_3952_length_4727_cov_2.586646_3_plen_71_part_00